MRRLWLGLGLVAAVGVLVASVAFAANAAGRGPRAVDAGGPGSGMMGGVWAPGSEMMGGGAGMMGSVWLVGDGAAVTSIPAARERAATASKPSGLHPGEVIWFDNGFYVELKDSTGASATEVIVDPAGGTVFTEPGPAMMWNTRHGMRGVLGGANTSISAQRAQQTATAWLEANLPGRVAQPPDSYPGYYTLETTTSDGTINGMLSVNAATGQVWYHSWHGRFIAKDDA